VEFDDVEWQTRDWLNVYKDNFHLLAVEANLVLANRPHGPQASNGPLHPALVRTSLRKTPLRETWPRETRQKRNL
jgi:hypothetical protein